MRVLVSVRYGMVILYILVIHCIIRHFMLYDFLCYMMICYTATYEYDCSRVAIPTPSDAVRSNRHDGIGT